MIYTIIGIILGYIYQKIVLPKKTKTNPKINITFYPILYNGMIIIPYNNKFAIHIHHWLIYLFILLLNVYLHIPDIIGGFAFVLTIQGLSYDDCFEFITHNPYK